MMTRWGSECELSFEVPVCLSESPSPALRQLHEVLVLALFPLLVRAAAAIDPLEMV